MSLSFKIFNVLLFFLKNPLKTQFLCLQSYILMLVWIYMGENRKTTPTKKNQNVIHCQLCISNCLFLIRVNGKIRVKIGKTVDLSSFVKEFCPN